MKIRPFLLTDRAKQVGKRLRAGVDAGAGRPKAARGRLP